MARGSVFRGMTALANVSRQPLAGANKGGPNTLHWPMGGFHNMQVLRSWRAPCGAQTSNCAAQRIPLMTPVTVLDTRAAATFSIPFSMLSSLTVHDERQRRRQRRPRKRRQPEKMQETKTFSFHLLGSSCCSWQLRDETRQGMHSGTFQHKMPWSGTCHAGVTVERCGKLAGDWHVLRGCHCGAVWKTRGWLGT